MGNLVDWNYKEIISMHKEAKGILKLLESIGKNAENYTSIIEWLKADTKTLRSEKPRISKFTTELEKQYWEAQILNTKLKALLTDTQKVKNSADDILKTLNKNSETSEDIAEKIQKLKLELANTKKDINSFYSEAQKKATKIQTLLTQAEKGDIVWKDILKFLKEAQIHAKNSQIELGQILTKWKEDFKKITNSKKEVEDLQWGARKLSDFIQKYHNDLFRTNWTKETIDNIERSIKANQSLIDQQLKNSSANRLCGMLEEHGMILKKTQENWWYMIFSLVVIILLFNSLPIIKTSIISNNVNITWTNFLGIEFILSFALIFSTLQYSSIKKQYEDYVFKHIAAFSLPAYLEFLEDKDQVVYAKFLTDTVSEIYKKPNNNSKDNLVEHVFDVLKSIFTKKIDLNWIIKDISDEKINELVKVFKDKL